MYNLRTFPLWTAVVTPFDHKGAIDYPSLEKLLRMQERASNACVLLGSTGEGLALEDAEKRAILQFAVGLKLKVPVIAGCGGFNLNATLSFLKFSEELGVDGYLLPMPLYSKPASLVNISGSKR
jgi:4-hydroxy-tetrahydrodipicolinate synthase